MSNHSSEPEYDPILKEKLKPHVYDGIQELDNRLPNWWLWTLYLAMLFSFVYWLSWYSSKVVDSDQERLDKNMAKIEAKRLEAAGEITNETLWAMSKNPSFLKEGEAIFVANCVQCHLRSLKGKDEGGIGESLVDAKWLYGNDPLYIYGMVSNGSPDKTSGMVAWARELGPKRITKVVSYVLSHHSPEDMAAAEVSMPDGP